MSKRNRFVEETPESKALKTFRLNSDLSLRKIANLMEISFTRVHQMEAGKENIPEDYINKFLEALNLTWEDWNSEVKGRDEKQILRDQCHEILDSIEPSKLELIHGILSNF